MKSVTVVALLVFVAVVALSQQPPAAKGSISGKLVPEYTGLNVSLARYTYDDNGEVQLVSFKTARSSSEIGKFGEYRFDDVEPGEYYVHATPAGLSGRAGETMPRTFYPGTDDLGKATRILLPSGANLTLGALNFFSVPTSAVRVRLIDATGDPSLNKGCTQVWVTSASSFNTILNRCSEGDPQTIPLPPMAPGKYDLFAGWGRPNASSPLRGAAVSFEVRNIDMELEVVVSFARVIGRILFEQPDGSLRPAAGLRLNFNPKHIGPTEWVETAADGSFRSDRVGRNDYLVEVSGLPPNAYIARLNDDAVDVLEEGLNVGSRDIQLDGLIGLAGGALEGSVVKVSNQKVPGAVVALIPDLPGRLKHLYRTATANEDGSFAISAIAPGSYQLFAWPKLNGAAYKNAEFMKNYAARGVPVVIEKNARTRIELKSLED